jgi:hypothetical protein
MARLETLPPRFQQSEFKILVEFTVRDRPNVLAVELYDKFSLPVCRQLPQAVQDRLSRGEILPLRLA